MHHLKVYYKTTLQYELVQKFKYSDIKKIFAVDKIVLSSGIEKFSVKNFLVFSLFVRILTSQNGRIIPSNVDVTKSGLRIQKGDPVGYKVTLRKKEFFTFLYKISERPNGVAKQVNLSNNKQYDSFILNVKDLLTFAQLDKQYKYMQNLKNLNVCLTANSKKPKEWNFYLKLLNV